MLILKNTNLPLRLFFMTICHFYSTSLLCAEDTQINTLQSLHQEYGTLNTEYTQQNLKIAELNATNREFNEALNLSKVLLNNMIQLSKEFRESFIGKSIEKRVQKFAKILDFPLEGSLKSHPVFPLIKEIILRSSEILQKEIDEYTATLQHITKLEEAIKSSKNTEILKHFTALAVDIFERHDLENRQEETMIHISGSFPTGWQKFSSKPYLTKIISVLNPHLLPLIKDHQVNLLRHQALTKLFQYIPTFIELKKTMPWTTEDCKNYLNWLSYNIKLDYIVKNHSEILGLLKMMKMIDHSSCSKSLVEIGFASGVLQDAIIHSLWLKSKILSKLPPELYAQSVSKCIEAHADIKTYLEESLTYYPKIKEFHDQQLTLLTQATADLESSKEKFTNPQSMEHASPHPIIAPQPSALVPANNNSTHLLLPKPILLKSKLSGKILQTYTQWKSAFNNLDLIRTVENRSFNKTRISFEDCKKLLKACFATVNMKTKSSHFKVMPGQNITTLLYTPTQGLTLETHTALPFTIVRGHGDDFDGQVSRKSLTKIANLLALLNITSQNIESIEKYIKSRS